MKCPNCQTELVSRLAYEETAPHTALALKRVKQQKCLNCGYAEREVVPYTEIKTCPRCKQDKYVIVKEDKEGVTKEGYILYCRKCSLEFPVEWK